MGKKILVVVDYQYDFFNPDGALYVKGGEKLQEKIANIIPDFDYVAFTQDWHPINHCSFIVNGGQWPTHCVAGTIGAGIPLKLIECAKQYDSFCKGDMDNEEEYGAFGNEYAFACVCDYDDKFINEYCEKDFISKSFNDVDGIVVCGIAGDYCVLETLKNIVNYIGTDKVSVYLDGVVSIDGGEKLNNYMKENNIKKYDDNR